VSYERALELLREAERRLPEGNIDDICVLARELAQRGWRP
jgi:hypothetical protein